MNRYISPFFVGSPLNCPDHPGIRITEELLFTYACLRVGLCIWYDTVSVEIMKLNLSVVQSVLYT
jgi:hypothetical protein